MRRLIVILLVVLWPLATVADVLDVPKSLAKAIKRNPDKYIQRIAGLIVGYGESGSIDGRGLENVIILARAKARALAIMRMTLDDLNGDGAVSGEEIQLAATVEGAAARGMMLVQFASNDADGNGALSAAEIRAAADLAALEGFTEQRANDLRAIMGFDADKDGRVNLDELRLGVGAVKQSVKANGVMPQVPQSPKAVSG